MPEIPVKGKLQNTGVPKCCELRCLIKSITLKVYRIPGTSIAAASSRGLKIGKTLLLIENWTSGSEVMNFFLP